MSLGREREEGRGRQSADRVREEDEVRKSREAGDM